MQEFNAKQHLVLVLARLVGKLLHLVKLSEIMGCKTLKFHGNSWGFAWRSVLSVHTVVHTEVCAWQQLLLPDTDNATSRQ